VRKGKKREGKKGLKEVEGEGESEIVSLKKKNVFFVVLGSTMSRVLFPSSSNNKHRRAKR
jgi:hypothetical protein